MFLLEYGVVSVYTRHERAIYRKLRKEPSCAIRPESPRMSVRDITLWWHVKHSAVTQQTQNWSPEWAQVILCWCWKDLKPPCHGNTGQHSCWSKVQKDLMTGKGERVSPRVWDAKIRKQITNLTQEALSQHVKDCLRLHLIFEAGSFQDEETQHSEAVTLCFGGNMNTASSEFC